MSAKRIVVLGSTGSIGTQTLEVADELGIKIEALTAGKNDRLLAEQARRHRPGLVAIADEEKLERLQRALRGSGIKVVGGEKGMLEAASADCHTVVSAIVGSAGLRPTAAAIEQGRTIALANKETLVTAGEYITELCRKNRSELIPVDSEHSAIFQSLQGQDKGALAGILLTASGGPFFGFTKQQLASVTPEQALKHPNWSMGAKITIDSATLMNKGFEMMEAMWLFGVPMENITVAVHRQSILHSAVCFGDGAVIGQMGSPDMKLPIQYALTYPKRLPCSAKPFDIFAAKSLTFEKPDEEAFGCLAACRLAAKAGGLAPAALNAANEVAVARFLEGRLGFLQICETAVNAVNKAPKGKADSIDSIMEADALARAEAERFIDSLH